MVELDYCQSWFGAHDWTAPIANQQYDQLVHFPRISVAMDNVAQYKQGQFLEVSTLNPYSMPFEPATLTFFTPVMPPGSNTFRLTWRNYYDDVRLRIDQIRFYKVTIDTDANADGMPDWMDMKLSRQCTVVSPSESFTSPACLEGTADLLSFMQIASSNASGAVVLHVHPGADVGWYANVPLATNAPTRALGMHGTADDKTMVQGLAQSGNPATVAAAQEELRRFAERRL